MNRNATLLANALFGALAVTSSPLRAQEHPELGKMWTFESPPLEYWKQVHDFQANPEWLDKVRLSALRLGNKQRPFCSAAFVSPNGLVMTNHHCVRDAVEKAASTAGKDLDWIRDGFVAGKQEEEVKLPDLRLEQLVASRDVTEPSNEGVAAGDSDEAIAKKRDANRKKILTEAREKEPGLAWQATDLFQGAVVMLYGYRRFEDVRLVCAPNLQTSHFGGDPDNFVYPRYCIDFAFVRCYEKDKPANTKDHYFKWNTSGIHEGELTFVVGNPGTTNRLKTFAQLEYMRDVSVPIQLQVWDHQIPIYKKYMEQDADLAKRMLPEILSQENGQKLFRGQLIGLQDWKLMEAKKHAEDEFKAKVKAKPELEKKYGAVWVKLAKLAEQRRALQPKSVFYNPGNSASLTRAVNIIRAVTADSDADRQQARAVLANMPKPSRSAMGVELLTDMLARAKQHLPADDPFLVALLKGEEPKKAVQALLASKLYDDATVEKLLDGDEKQLKELNDRVLNAAIVLLPLLTQVQKEDARLRAEEGVQSTLLGQALFACYGKKISPDATMTLRVQDGIVKGYPCNGSLAPWRTTFYGLYARNTEFDNRHPFDLAKPWIERKDRIDMTKSLDFVSTNDIIGGNSGSSMINTKGEVIGLIFDGNMESIPNSYLYRDDIPRTVSVHVDAIIEALTKVYDAGWIADELIGTKGA